MDEPFVATEKPDKNWGRRGRKLLELAVYAILILIVAVLFKSFLDQQHLKTEVNEATKVTDQIITTIRKEDGAAALKLSYKTFKADNSAEALTASFKSISKYTVSPTSVKHQIVSNDSAGQAVSIIYSFQSKPALYVRILVIKPNDTKQFQMAKLNIDTDEAKLVKLSQ